MAHDEIRPEYGKDESKMEVYFNAPLYNFGKRYQNIISDCLKILKEVQENQVPLASIILHGKTGTGKTSIAVSLAQQSNCPFVKFITAEDMIGSSELYKVNYINKCFEDAYKSK